MANLLLPVLTTIAERARANFVKKTRRTSAVQEQLLKELLQTHKHTELGRKYGLRDIRTIEQFQQQIPILPYSSYEPYTERIAQGEKNILTPDPVVYLNTTSGSTGNQKLIPVTQRFQNSLGWANLTCIGFLGEALRSQDRKFGKLLVTNTAQITGRTSGGIEYGPGGTGVLRMGKFLYEQLFAHPYETLQAADSITRHYLCFLFALRDRSMRGIGANFPMLILRICNYLERYAEDLIRDIETGTIASWLTLEPELRAKLERQWSANPSRAAQLREILKSEGRLTPKLAWPELSFTATARGGTSDFYFERFPSYFDDIPSFGAVFASAEGTFSIYHDLNNDGSILAIEAGFFEFIPQDQWEVEHPKTLLATEVKAGELYRILMTNYSGFYRYDIGDVVEVLGFYEQAPLIVFRHRRGGILSSTTEKTTEFHATQVMQSLQQEFGLPLEDFCITLSENEFPAHYLVNIELVSGPILSDSLAFLASFDRKLKETNVYYQSKRKDQVPPPRLRILAPGSFAKVRQRQVERGIPDSQLKFPHISEDRNFLAGLEVEQEVRLPEDRD
ncbi:GH3 auxin-responsive promoter family protein [Coleofasciculus sp. FACHB-64]|uniref:GH3 auxin-responsive promoter family protein n=1 Tax=Cyanophyceae TaxID=3028117 RepID=UPI00168A04F0|nr:MULTISPECIES: GH3 auxin-responsive promoter family protein [unclassified Coleofasciculus]MBD1839253.1 GH3 auxin-responsive promoter family protein [Coleofasciculus sp. FACHB-501]MBD2045670.1 GH3 auxin-responsive promoter family protein [Coleofasciculus sp. FACHB-64]